MYADFCALMTVTIIGGAKYSCKFSDEYSGFRSVFMLKMKSEVQDIFPSFCKSFERQYGCNLKSLHTDRGGEFLELKPYLMKHGIRHDISSAYTPQKNSVDERLNRTILYMSLAILSQAYLPN